MVLPLAHHQTIMALPVFAPAVVIVIVLIVHHLRERRHWDEEEAES
jgi:GAF domain-containing protein